VDVRFHEIGLVARTLHAVSTPVAVYVLLVLVLWGLAFELTQPGLGLAGIGGGVFLAFAIYGLTVIPVHWIGIVLILAGMAMQGLDVILRRFGVLTFAGTAVFAVGSAWAWWAVAPNIDVPWWLITLLTVSGFLLFGFGFTVALRARELAAAPEHAGRPRHGASECVHPLHFLATARPRRLRAESLGHGRARV